nr:immunoglobulin light chain junction region [Macaca mulatta]MOV61971.1 immunoglobulin light chain junction region [Macaca mulatta]
CQQYYGLPLTL